MSNVSQPAVQRLRSDAPRREVATTARRTRARRHRPLQRRPALAGPRATAADVDAAYVGAQAAARLGRRRPRGTVRRVPAGRRDHRPAAEELVDWLIREAGTTRMRALVELGIVRATTMAAVTHTSLGEVTVATDVPGQGEPGLHPAGRCGRASSAHGTSRCTSPTARSRPRSPSATPWCSSRPRTRPVTGGLLIAKILEEAGLPPGVLERRGRARLRGRRRDGRAPGAAGHLVHRLDPGRAGHHPEGRRQAAGPRTRRQRPVRRPGRRRPGARGRGRGVQQLLAPGPDLHGDQPRHRRRRGARRVRGAVRRRGGGAA